jgi:replicative DNA helicase
MSEFKTAEWAKKEEPIIDDVARALPHAVGPEKSLLSSMLQNPEEYLDLAIEAGITESHFYLPQNSTIFAVLVEMREAGQEIEFVRLVQGLLDTGRLSKCGGASYFSELYTYSPSPGHFRHHLQLVKDKHLLRQMIRLSNSTVADAYENPEDPGAVIDNLERGLMEIREGTLESGDSEGNKEAMARVIENFRRSVSQEPNPNAGLKTGFEVFDSMTGGLRGGEMIVIAARPSMGKTSFMMNIVENICIDQSIPTLVFSAEMNKDQLLDRLLFARAKYFKGRVSRGYTLTKQEGQRIQVANNQILASPLFIDDSSNPSISELRAKARRMVRMHGIRFIAIDYLQLLKAVSKQALGSREREVAEISGGVKALAKDLNVPILILAQINRDSEKRGGKAKGVPRMSDLRESGAIEQDADIVGLLTRAKQFADDNEERKALEGVAELILAKNRNGATGSIPLTFIEELMRFETGAPVEEKESPTFAKQGKRSDLDR